MDYHKTAILNAVDSRQAVRMHVGSHLIVRLECNASSGFLWEVTECNNEILEQIGPFIFEQDTDWRSNVGAAGVSVWTFLAKRCGTSELRLLCRRPFDLASPPSRTFSVTVAVMPV